MKADVSGIGEHLAFQFDITGEGQGTFYAEVKEGKLYVEPYEYYDRDAIFICSADTLLKLAARKIGFLIFAFTTGKLKVEGSLEKALMLQKLSRTWKGVHNDMGRMGMFMGLAAGRRRRGITGLPDTFSTGP